MNDNTISYTEFSGRLVTLNNGRTGIRGGLHVQVREPSGSQPSTEAGPARSNSQPVLDFVSSDESLDRYNEVISATGWKLDNYRKNPVFQNAHQTGDIMHPLGRATATEVRGGKLVQTIEFACDVNPMARIAYGLYKGQFLNAVSVGFVPIRWKDGNERSADFQSAVSQTSSLHAPEDSELSIFTGSSDAPTHQRANAPRRIFLEQELLEVSAVAIPANPNALALGLKSGAVDKSDMKDVVELFKATLSSAERSDAPERNRNSGSSPSSLRKKQFLQIAQEFTRLVKS